MHRLLALGTGLLIGTIFYHMLPESVTGSGAATSLLAGLLGLFVVERLVFASKVESEPGGSHNLLGATAYLGLSIHALTVGLGMAAQLSEPDARLPLLTSLLIHKCSEAFALATILLLAGVPRFRAMLLLVAFAFIEPLGLIAGNAAYSLLPAIGQTAIRGLATGTFLYVALCDLLPEVFHDPERRWATLTLLLSGVAIIGLLSGPGHTH